MKTFTFLLFVLLLNSLNAFAQKSEACSCCTEMHQAFNFWLGDWTVYNMRGEIVGSNKVVKIQDGCGIQENWVSKNNKNTGTSYNFYNSKDSTWKQVWISNTGKVLELKGGLDSVGNMVLKSELRSSVKGKFYNQITWSKKSDGSIFQHWEVFNENDEKIRSVFQGIYRKKKMK